MVLGDRLVYSFVLHAIILTHIKVQLCADFMILPSSLSSPCLGRQGGCALRVVYVSSALLSVLCLPMLLALCVPCVPAPLVHGVCLVLPAPVPCMPFTQAYVFPLLQTGSVLGLLFCGIFPL